MKYILCSLAIASLPFTGQARGFEIIPGAGYGGMIYSGNNLDYYSYKQSGGKFNYLGLQAGFMFNDHIGLFTGIGRTVYHWGVVSTNPKVLYEDRIEQSYLEIPVFARFATGGKGKVGFLAKIGLSVALLQNVAEQIQDDTTKGMSTKKDGYQKAIVNLRYTLGVRVPVGKTVEIEAGPECRYSLIPNFETNTGFKGNHLAISGYLGIIIKLHR